MTSIYDVPYEDIEKFLLANNKNWNNENEAYETSFDLLKNKNVRGHTTRIIEWMIAHNLLVNKINIPHFTIDEIDNMTQNEINKLAKLLTMKGNNVNNIKNILRYLHKLDEEDIVLLPEINDLILDTLYDVEKTDRMLRLTIEAGSSRDILELLEKHHNKKIIRELILDNMEEIVDNLSISIYNMVSFIVELLDHDELGLAKKFYDYLKLLPEFGPILNRLIFNQIYHQYGDFDILLQRIFKIMPAVDLFDILIEKMKNITNMDIRLESLYIPFLETAIDLQKVDFIILILEYFNKKSFEYLKKVNPKIEILVKRFEDLIDIAKEMV